MPFSIISDNFRTQISDAFINSINDNSLYLFLSRPQSWNTEEYSGLQSVSDTSPPNINDSDSFFYNIYNDIIAAKKIGSNNIRKCIRRLEWKPNTIYDMYKPNYSITNPTANGDITLNESNFYVINTNYQVFKCLYNGQTPEFPTGVATTIGSEPTVVGSPTNPIVTSDGYVWKYMYSLTIDDIVNFASLDFIPIGIDTVVQNSSVDGGIFINIINNRGTNLNPGVYYSKIYGDGNDGVVKITVSNDSQSSLYQKISLVEMVSNGTGYSHAFIDIQETFSDISCTIISDIGVTSLGKTYITPIISPKGGHGKDPSTELGAYRVMVVMQFSAIDGDGDVPIDLSFRRYGLLSNPTVYGGTTVINTNSFVGCYSIKLPDSFNGVYNIGETITQDTTNASGVVLHFDSTNNVLRYYQNYYSGDGKFVRFQGENNITGSISNSTSLPDINYTSGGSNPDNIMGLVFNSGYTNPDINPYSGKILYVEHRNPIIRSLDQAENIKIILEF